MNRHVWWENEEKKRDKNILEIGKKGTCFNRSFISIILEIL